MERSLFLRRVVSELSMIWMWFKLLIFQEAVFWLTVVSHVGILSWFSVLFLVSLFDAVFENKIPTVNQEAQTGALDVEHKSVQTDVFMDCAMKPEESRKNELENVDIVMSSETATLESDCNESVESSSGDIDFDSKGLPEPIALEAAVARRLGIKTTVKKMKFLVPTDPHLFIDDEVSMKDDKVAQWYLNYIKEKHEKKQKEKQLSFFQRKLKKIKKHLKKGKNDKKSTS